MAANNSITENPLAVRVQAFAKVDPQARAVVEELRTRSSYLGSKLTVTEIEEIARCSRRRALDIAQRFSALGLGNFRAGRRGHDSRVEWHWSTRNNGKVIFAEPQPPPEPPDIMAAIAVAKAQLSGKLGVPETAIEISIRT